MNPHDRTQIMFLEAGCGDKEMRREVVHSGAENLLERMGGSVLSSGDDFTSICLHPPSPQCTLKHVGFIECLLYLNNAGQDCKTSCWQLTVSGGGRDVFL